MPNRWSSGGRTCGRSDLVGGHDPKLAEALVRLAALDEPPLRFPAGADAVATFETRAKLLLELADANREMSSNLDHDDV